MGMGRRETSGVGRWSVRGACRASHSGAPTNAAAREAGAEGKVAAGNGCCAVANAANILHAGPADANSRNALVAEALAIVGVRRCGHVRGLVWRPPDTALRRRIDGAVDPQQGKQSRVVASVDVRHAQLLGRHACRRAVCALGAEDVLWLGGRGSGGGGGGEQERKQ